MITFYATIIGPVRHLCGSLFWKKKRFFMICLPFFCAMVLYAESVRINPINIRPSCEAWEMERCEVEAVSFMSADRRRVTIFDPNTGEINARIKKYHQVCLDNDPWIEECESFVGEYYIEESQE